MTGAEAEVDREEGWLLRGRDRGAWLGSVAGEAADQLADDAHLDDLIDGDQGADVLPRASRLPRMRPVLVVLAARASGAEDVDDELQYAAELLHGALAVHDLALGQSGGRRRRLARKVLSRSANWLGGNQLILRAMELARAGGVPAVLDEMFDTLRAFQEGQALSSELVHGGHPTVTSWSEHADGHTGALFSFCTRAGALAGGAGRGQAAVLGRFGRHLGRMWHVAEDVCLLEGDDGAEHLLGRSLIGRPMLPVAVAVERDARVAEAWRGLLEDPYLDRAEALLERVQALNGIRGTREQMAREQWDARQALSRLPEDAHRARLERLVSGLSKAPYEV